MKVFSKLLLGLFVGLFGFISFSSASQLYGYAKLKSKNTSIPSYAPSGTTFYTDFATMDLKGYTGTIKLFVQSSYNCSPGNIMVKNGNTYTRYQMSFISSQNLCVSPEIPLNGSSFQFFYATTQNTSNFFDVQIQLLDLDSFNTSVVAYTTIINASVSLPTVCPDCPISSINVLYNNENSSTTINCNGDNVIQIDGLSTITATNKFTPYFNINYRDQDNQLLIESYSKDSLYLKNGLFKKTYTGDNEWILTNQSDCIVDSGSFSGYLPTFDVTGGINEVVESGNIFNNFAENSVKLTLSNIPSYIQYVIIFMLLLFILGFIKRFKRK